MALRKEEVENPMVRPMPIKYPLSFGKCTCGCGEWITENYCYIRWDNHYFNDDACVRRYLKANFDYVEVG